FSTAPGGQAPVAPPSVSGNFGESPREYLDRSGAKANPSKITALGLYLRAQETESFTSRNIRDLFVAAGEAAPKNLSRDINRAIQAGWLASRPDQTDAYYITNRGEGAAAAGFSERPSPPRRPNRSKGRSSSNPEEGSSVQSATRNGGGARSVLDGLLEENYFAEPRTSGNIVQAASEKGHRLLRTDLSQPLLTLVQARPPRLRRQKMTIAGGAHRPVWAYTNPQPVKEIKM
ncbi:MAG: hypothetical protein ACREQD_10470, partial [Candidatus Binataceae bacterium]